LISSRNVLIEKLAALKGTKGEYLTREDIEWMYRYAEDVIYPTKQ
jgi:hypothetical protein